MVGRDGSSRTEASPGTGPAHAGLVLATLILVAAVANLNLSVANVALPSIGQHLDSSQTTLDLVAVGYSLGLACSVLWLGALGDRYGRKEMLVWGTVLAVPFWAYLSGIVAVLLGAAIVAVFFPKAEQERQLLARYRVDDAGGRAVEAVQPEPTAA